MTKIFIVEDDPILLKMYTKKFEKDGFQVDSAVDGEEAVQKIGASSPAPGVILLDVMLPKLDGFGVLEKIKQNPAVKDVPVILSTNLGGGEEDRKKGQQLGATDYLIKSDYTPAQIVEKIKSYIKA